MEWVVTTGKTVEEAKDRALDQLGVAADEAEFEVVEEARTGLFGRVKAEAQVRARVRPTQVRPKQDRRERRRGKTRPESKGDVPVKSAPDRSIPERPESGSRSAGASESGHPSNDASRNGRGAQAGASQQRSKSQRQQKESASMNEEPQSDVTPQEVGDAAVAFMDGLTSAFGLAATAEVDVDGTDLDVRVKGDDLGLLVGPGGRTLTAVQDLVRVAAQRRLGDHETRLRVDVGGYREKRRAALERFALAVASEVVEHGQPKALEPMSSSDRKVVHDAITGVEGVSSRSEGDDPNRRVVIAPS
jgi:spoIIIJ-associated protein